MSELENARAAIQDLQHRFDRDRDKRIKAEDALLLAKGALQKIADAAWRLDCQIIASETLRAIDG